MGSLLEHLVLMGVSQQSERRVQQFHEDVVWTKLDVKPAYGCYGFDQTLGDTPKRAIS